MRGIEYCRSGAQIPLKAGMIVDWLEGLDA